MLEIKKHIAVFLKGFCMGAADIIPGVSGGTIAFLMGIYEEFIEAICSFNMQFLQDILKGRFGPAFGKTGWKFLSVLLSGILTAIFLLSHMLKWLMADYPIYVYAFFFGIIFTTVFVIAQKIHKADFAKLSLALISAILMYRFVGMVPVQTPEAWWFLFLSGAVAICAMILPGISGAFILLVLGKYEFIIAAVSDRDVGVLLTVALGCAVGLISFVRILRWMLHRHYDVILSILAGLVLGSLRRIWPWKETLSTQISVRGKIIPLEQVNVFPRAINSEILFAILLFVAGICLSLWLASFDQDREKGSAQILSD